MCFSTDLRNAIKCLKSIQNLQFVINFMTLKAYKKLLYFMTLLEKLIKNRQIKSGAFLMNCFNQTIVATTPNYLCYANRARSVVLLMSLIQSETTIYFLFFFQFNFHFIFTLTLRSSYFVQ